MISKMISGGKRKNIGVNLMYMFLNKHLLLKEFYQKPYKVPFRFRDIPKTL